MSERILEDQENWLPVKQLGEFAEAAVYKSGRWDLGLEASMGPRLQHSEFSRKYLFTPTLYRSLRTLCDNSAMEDTSASFRLSPGGDMTWLGCSSVRGTPEAIRQIELYRFGALLEVIRLAGGKNWVPPLLHLQSVDDGRLDDVPLIRDTNVKFATPRLAIQIPTRLLGRPLRADGSVPDISDGDMTTKTGNDDVGGFETTMKEVVQSQMIAGVTGIKDVASSLGVSKRTFQRILKEYKLTFSELLERTRMEMAQELMSETDMSHGQISRELGYRHSTHFSRAFRRVCGMTPRQYRSYESAG